MGREHWVECKLGDIFSFVIGGDWGKDVKSDETPVEVYVLRSNELSGRNIKYASKRFIKTNSFEKRKLEEGNIIIEISGGGPTQPVGRTLLINEKTIKNSELPLICSNFFRKITITENISSGFVNYFFKKVWFEGEINNYQNHTTGIRNLDFNKFCSEVSIPLPPLNEQKRIVEKLDAILPKVKNAKARLENIPKILKKFRQSVLADACSGKLTEEWREGKNLPEWEDKKFEDVGTLGRGRSKHRPRNDPKLFNGLYPFIQTGDVAQSKEYIVAHYQTLNEVGLAQSKMWPENTLCITIAANIANTAILSYPACFPDSVVGFINDKNQSELKFVKWVIDNIKNDLENYAPATAQKNINLGILNEVVFKCPSLFEQHEIVRRVEKLFALADSLEEKYKIAIARVEKIEQSVLAKAFRGELVEPDPNDEPAEILLKRILDVRAKDVSPQRKPKKRA